MAEEKCSWLVLDYDLYVKLDADKTELLWSIKIKAGTPFKLCHSEIDNAPLFAGWNLRLLRDRASIDNLATMKIRKLLKANKKQKATGTLHQAANVTSSDSD